MGVSSARHLAGPASRQPGISQERIEVSQKVLVFEPDKCIGCRLCEQWCSLSHYNVASPARSRIRVQRHHESQIDYAVYCRQCTDAPCIDACRKFEALSRDSATGAIIVDQEKCVGCRACLRACPHGAPSLLPDKKKTIICDLCGGTPECVSHCPEAAIQYLESHKANNIYRSVLIEAQARGGATHV
jgi:Fe-S-cluster-containing hydrogenase component 2